MVKKSDRGNEAGERKGGREEGNKIGNSSKIDRGEERGRK